MAKKLNEFAFEQNRKRQKHPWDLWFSGEVWELTRGEDFDCKVESMVSGIYASAYRRGLKVRVQADRDAGTIILQAQRETP